MNNNFNSNLSDNYNYNNMNNNFNNNYNINNLKNNYILNNNNGSNYNLFKMDISNNRYNYSKQSSGLSDFIPNNGQEIFGNNQNQNISPKDVMKQLNYYNSGIDNNNNEFIRTNSRMMDPNYTRNCGYLKLSSGIINNYNTEDKKNYFTFNPMIDIKYPFQKEQPNYFYYRHSDSLDIMKGINRLTSFGSIKFDNDNNDFDESNKK